MKKFNFRLAGLLRIREFEEKNAWNEVLKQESRLQNIKNKIDNLQMGIASSRQMTLPAEHASVLSNWQLAEEAISGMGARIEILELEYAQETKLLEKLVARHQEAKKESKILENFKERKSTEFKVEKNKMEAKQSIDFATQSHMRKQSKGS